MKLLRLVPFLFFAGCVAAPSLPPGAVLPSERFEVGWEGEQWIKVSEQSRPMIRLIEYVRKGDSPDNWREIITDQAVIMQVPDAKTAVESHFQGLRRKADGFQSRIISESPREVSYEWWHSDRRGYGPEHVIGLAVRAPYSVTFFTYAKKGETISDNDRELWIKRLTSAKYR